MPISLHRRVTAREARGQRATRRTRMSPERRSRHICRHVETPRRPGPREFAQRRYVRPCYPEPDGQRCRFFEVAKATGHDQHGVAETRSVQTTHSLRVRHTGRERRKPDSRRARRGHEDPHGPNSQASVVSGSQQSPRDGRAWLARRRPGPAFKGARELRTQALRNQVALVFSIPVCPSPREARSGQSGFSSVLLCQIALLRELRAKLPAISANRC
jgi:hypothetical protein